MRVTSVSSSNASVSATVEPITLGKEYKVTLALRPNTPDGALRGLIAITTDDPQQQTVSFPYFGIVRIVPRLILLARKDGRRQ